MKNGQQGQSGLDKHNEIGISFSRPQFLKKRLRVVQPIQKERRSSNCRNHLEHRYWIDSRVVESLGCPTRGGGIQKTVLLHRNCVMFVEGSTYGKTIHIQVKGAFIVEDRIISRGTTLGGLSLHVDKDRWSEVNNSLSLQTNQPKSSLGSVVPEDDLELQVTRLKAQYSI